MNNIQELIDTVSAKPGWHVRRTKKNHFIVTGPDGQMVVLPSTTGRSGITIAKKRLHQAGAI